MHGAASAPPLCHSTPVEVVAVHKWQANHATWTLIVDTDEEVMLMIVLLYPVLADIWSVAVDSVVILVALVSLIALTLIATLALEVLGLVRQVRGEITPLLDQARETVRAVHGTTAFVRTGLVKPAIQTASIAAGVLRTISVLRRGVIHPRPDTFKEGE